nr:MAG TPA: hypothetical protein [Caudoviricetes sp.]
MYDPTAVNDIANWIVLAAAIPAVTFVFLYGILSPWYRSWLGVTMFGVITSVAAVLVFVTVRRWLHEFPGYELWAVVIYSLFLLSLLGLVVVFIVERRHAGLLVFSIRRRERKDS